MQATWAGLWDLDSVSEFFMFESQPHLTQVLENGSGFCLPLTLTFKHFLGSLLDITNLHIIKYLCLKSHLSELQRLWKRVLMHDCLKAKSPFSKCNCQVSSNFNFLFYLTSKIFSNTFSGSNIPLLVAPATFSGIYMPICHQPANQVMWGLA